MRKRKAKDVQEFDEFEVKMKVVKTEARMTQGRRCGQNGWKHERIQTSLGTSRLVSALEKAVLSLKSRTKCTKRCGWSSGYFGPHPRQRSLQRVLLANASFADLKAWRNSDTISFYVVPPEELRRKRKIWRLLKNRCGIRDTSQVFATHVEEGLNKHGLRKDAVVPWRYWKATLKTRSVHW